MAKYISKYSGERIDKSVGTIPETNPAEDSVLVISKTGEGSYKKVSEIGASGKLYRHQLTYSFLDSGGQRQAGNVVFISLNSKRYAENGEGSIATLKDVISVEQWNPSGYNYYPAYFYTDMSGDYYLAAIGVTNVARLLLSADYSYDTFQDVVTEL